MVNIVIYTCPNRSGVGAIDSPDHLEHVFDPYYIQKKLEKIFTRNVLMICPRRLDFFSAFKAFVKDFPYYDLY